MTVGNDLLTCCVVTVWQLSLSAERWTVSQYAASSPTLVGVVYSAMTKLAAAAAGVMLSCSLGTGLLALHAKTV